MTLAEFDLQDRTHEINKVAAELAREAADSFSDGRHRWVVGSIGPGTKLPSLGNIAYDPLEAALAAQSRGLIAGGVDAILIETCQDTLQIKAAVNGAKIARAEAGTDTPIFVQVTVETTGTLLVGPDIAAAATVVHALDVPLIGLNCATGPQEMARARPLAGGQLARPALGAAECRPAGAGRRQDPLPARRRADGELGRALRRRGRAEPDRRLLRHLHAAHPGAGRDAARGGAASAPRRSRASRSGCRRSPASTARRRCGRRTATSPSASAATPTAPRSGGSCRRAATGTAASPWAASRSREGSNSLDVCTAFVGRDEVMEMNEVITRFTSSVNAPLVIDSTETQRDRGRAEAAWRQADHQLDQLRGWRGGGATTG